MTQEEKPKKKQYVYVKDDKGIEYICRLEDLKRADQLSEEEKDKRMGPPRGCVKPLGHWLAKWEKPF